MARTRRTCGIFIFLLPVLVVPASCQLNPSVSYASRQFLQWEMFVPSDQIHHHDKYSELCVTPYGLGQDWANKSVPTLSRLTLFNCADRLVEDINSFPEGFFGFILPDHKETGPIHTGSDPDLCWTPEKHTHWTPDTPANSSKRLLLDHCTGGTEQDFMAFYSEQGKAVLLTWPSEMLNIHVGPDSKGFGPRYRLLVSNRTPHWFTLRSEGLSWEIPLAPALYLGACISSVALLAVYIVHLVHTWIVNGLRLIALVKAFSLATLSSFFERGAIDKEAEQIYNMFVQLRIQRAQSASYWALHLLLVPTMAFNFYWIHYSELRLLNQWGHKSIRYQHNLQDYYVLEGTLIMACTLYVVSFPTLAKAKSFHCINVFFSILCIVSSLIRGPSFSNKLAPFFGILSFRIFYSIAFGNTGLTLLLQIAITFVELIGVDFVPYGSWVAPQREDLGIALGTLSVIVTLAWLNERQTLREATSVYQATVEKEIRERLLTVMVDGNLSVKRDQGGVFRINALDASASQLLGVAPGCSIVGESLECLTPSGEDLVAVVTEAQAALEGPALLREIPFTTQYGQHVSTKSYVVGTPSGVTIALLVTDELSTATHVPAAVNAYVQEMPQWAPEKSYLMRTTHSSEIMVPKAYRAGSSSEGDIRESEPGSHLDYILNGSDVISDSDDAHTFRSMDANSHKGGQMVGPYDQNKASLFRSCLSSAMQNEQGSPSRLSHTITRDLSSGDVGLSGPSSDLSTVAAI